MSNAMKVQNPGFFMLELLIALAIMSIFWVIMAQYQGNAIQMSYDAQKRMQALNLANNVLDSALKQKKLPTSQQHSQDEFKISWKTKPHPILGFNTVVLSNKKKQFCLLTVQVAWSHNNHEQIVALTSGMCLAKENQ